jgi:hypothetical protein
VTALAWHPGRDWDAVARDDCRRFARARASRDPRVRHALVERHLPLARHIAAWFAAAPSRSTAVIGEPALTAVVFEVASGDVPVREAVAALVD